MLVWVCVSLRGYKFTICVCVRLFEFSMCDVRMLALIEGRGVNENYTF